MTASLLEKPRIYTCEALAPLDAVPTPLWVVEIDSLHRWWANRAALAYWRASSNEELRARNATAFISEASKRHAQSYRGRLERGEPIHERWTFYPDGGGPAEIVIRLTALWIRDGEDAPERLAMLCEGRPVESDAADAALRRSAEALRHVGELVTLYSDAGAPVLRNPAAEQAFGDVAESPAGVDGFAASFVDPSVPAAARATLASGQTYAADALVRTRAGERWHGVEVRRVIDPVSGAPAVLVNQRDLSERIAYEQALEDSRARLAAQAEELTHLAAPVLRVAAGVLVLPLIGRIDAARMDAALAALLPRAASERVREVIFDLTGARIEGSQTADALRRATQMLRLQGISPRVAGVGPALALALVAAGEGLPAETFQSVEDALQRPGA